MTLCVAAKRPHSCGVLQLRTHVHSNKPNSQFQFPALSRSHSIRDPNHPCALPFPTIDLTFGLVIDWLKPTAIRSSASPHLESRQSPLLHEAPYSPSNLQIQPPTCYAHATLMLLPSCNTSPCCPVRSRTYPPAAQPFVPLPHRRRLLCALVDKLACKLSLSFI